MQVASSWAAAVERAEIAPSHRPCQMPAAFARRILRCRLTGQSFDLSKIDGSEISERAFDLLGAKIQVDPRLQGCCYTRLPVPLARRIVWWTCGFAKQGPSHNSETARIEASLPRLQARPGPERTPRIRSMASTTSCISTTFPAKNCGPC